ncbi:MAG: fused MFS/spermidine synthase [Acidobacteriota bacterium]|nr:fused MFS/spermidine synthase [Acidobacteriota bacterium]
MSNRRAVFALFFFSGIAGLVYQVLWLRRLSLVFGVTVYAASTVLAAFMAGLAIGSLLAGYVLRRRISPLLAFGAAEILIGVTGFASPYLLSAASALYGGLQAAAPESLGLLTVARLASSLAILVVPTALMGMTLPLLSAAVAATNAPIASRISLLYAVNTTGAMVGTVLTGFLLIPAIGVQRAFMTAAAVNIAVGILALWVGRSYGPAVHAETVGAALPTPALSRVPLLLAAVVAISGFASLGLEILWFRLMLQFVVATTEAFTAMLATVLFGIAMGGFLAARILRTGTRATMWLAVVQAATGFATVASMSFLLWTIAAGWKTTGLWTAVLIAILPAAIAMGVGFPLALGLATGDSAGGHDRAEIGRRVGVMYALNVAGAIAGSLAAGFLLLPWLGAQRALIAMAALYVGSGLMVAARGGRLALVAVGVIAIAFVPVARGMADPFTVAIDRRYGNTLQELWRDEGAQTAVSVRANRFQRVLYLDGLHQANDQPPMVELHRAIGHLPMVLHGSPRDVLVVGMGGGATPGAVSQYPGAEVLVVELSESVRRAAPFFSHVNYDLLERPNITIRIDDGRNFLSLTDRRFDVITADIIQPGHAGAGHVYSREYFELVRGALKDDGLVLQWIGHRPSIEYGLIMRTFLAVFPDATLWYDGNFMIGSRTPLTIAPDRFERLRSTAETRTALDAVGLTSFAALRSWYTAGAAEMQALIGPGPVLTDDRPLVEYQHWLPPASEQPPLDLSSLKGDVNRIIAGGGQ